MNVEIGTETAQFPEKEYKNGIFVAAQFLVVSLFSLFHKILPTFQAAKFETMYMWQNSKTD
jgi:hypothetical protein